MTKKNHVCEDCCPHPNTFDKENKKICRICGVVVE